MSETENEPDIEEFEMEEEEDGEEREHFIIPEEHFLPDKLEEEMLEEQDEEETVETIPEKQSISKNFAEKYGLDDKAISEINRCHDPSYTNVKFPYYLICEKRLVERMKQVRSLLKSEVEKITAEQTSAFESIRIRRLYKTGMGLPEGIFIDHEKVYTFKELERLRFIMNNEVV